MDADVPRFRERRLTDPLTYRFARQADIPAAARLAAHSFPGTGRSLETWEAQLRDPAFGGGPETLLVGESAGTVHAALQLHPLQQWIGGERLPVTGIGTVAVSPAQRRRGIAAALVRAGLRAGRERGDVASALYPFRTSFYADLGYGQAGEAHQYQVATSALPDAGERVRVELLESEGARREALALYGRWAATQTGQLERLPGLWETLCCREQRALAGYRGESGTLEGYALVTYRAELPRRDRYLEVDELVWATAAARRGLYGWLASLADQWEQVLLRALPSHRLGEWLREPRLPAGAAPAWGLWAPSATVLAGPMFRLLDLPGAFARRSVPPGARLAVTVEVNDGQLPENHGRWRLVLEGGRVAAERATRSSFTLGLSIGTLSRLFIGALSPSDACASGLLECDRPQVLAALDAALALPQPWTFDRF